MVVVVSGVVVGTGVVVIVGIGVVVVVLGSVDCSRDLGL